MDLDRHDFQLDDLVEKIKQNDNRLIALQVPEGLKMQALEMMDEIETETSAKVVLAADPCYGACDLVHDKMKMMGVELVAHMGHSQMNIDSGMPTEFIDVTYDGDPELNVVLPILNKHLAMAKERMANQDSNKGLSEAEAQEKFLDAVGRMAPLTDTKLGLVGSIQHLHLLPEFNDRLEKAGFDVEIPIGGARLSFPGQVLGCNYSGDDPRIGHYLFLGSGDFHPIGLVLHTGKPLAMLDPYSGTAEEMSFEIAALVEPFAVALRTIHRSNLDPDSKIAVCGLVFIVFATSKFNQSTLKCGTILFIFSTLVSAILAILINQKIILPLHNYVSIIS